LEEIGKTIIGRLFEADFGEKTYTLLYESNTKLTLTEVIGPNVGKVQDLSVTMVELRPNLFMVNWQEANKLTVTDIEDYINGVVYANMTTSNDNFISVKGTLREKK
jgi:hypothetical protein